MAIATAEILESIDKEIARLTEVRSILSPSVRRGRPKVARTKGSLSPAGRKRIAEAMRKRWAARKRAAKKASK